MFVLQSCLTTEHILMKFSIGVDYVYKAQNTFYNDKKIGWASTNSGYIYT